MMCSGSNAVRRKYMTGVRCKESSLFDKQPTYVRNPPRPHNRPACGSCLCT